MASNSASLNILDMTRWQEAQALHTAQGGKVTWTFCMTAILLIFFSAISHLGLSYPQMLVSLRMRMLRNARKRQPNPQQRYKQTQHDGLKRLNARRLRHSTDGERQST